MKTHPTTEALRSLVENVERVIRGKRRTVEFAACSLFAGQHLLIEDVPGVGKTMLGRAVARSISGTFKRIQGTSDLLPTDITGSTVFDQGTRAFTFVPGPVFANVVLVDEINRATPKSQSALLEVMEERSVTADGELHRVPEPFFVVATRNPTEHHGTFPLPEGELDRFGLSIEMGYPDMEAERRVITGQMHGHPIEDLQAVLRPDEVSRHQEEVRRVHVDPAVLDYLLSIVRTTRDTEGIALGASPRGSLALTRVSQAYALLRGRDHILPDDVKSIAPLALTHRLSLASDRPSNAGRGLVEEILRSLRAPVGVDAEARGAAS